MFCILFYFALDAIVICALVSAFNNESETDWVKAGLSGLGIAAVSNVIALALTPFGLFALLPALGVVLFVAGGVFLLVFGMPPGKAALAGGLFLAYRIFFTIMLHFMATP